MKIKTCLLLFGLILFTSLQVATAQKAQIVGKWNPDMEVMKPILMELIEKEMGNSDDEAQKEMMKGMIDMLLQSFSEMSMEFRADGTYSSSSKNPMTQEEENKTGTWSFEDGYIITKEDDAEDEDKVMLKDITADKMVLFNDDEEGSPIKEFVMKRAK